MMDIIQKFIHLQVKEEKKQMPDGSEQVTKKKRLISQDIINWMLYVN